MVRKNLGDVGRKNMGAVVRKNLGAVVRKNLGAVLSERRPFLSCNFLSELINRIFNPLPSVHHRPSFSTFPTHLIRSVHGPDSATHLVHRKHVLKLNTSIPRVSFKITQEHNENPALRFNKSDGMS